MKKVVKNGVFIFALIIILIFCCANKTYSSNEIITIKFNDKSFYDIVLKKLNNVTIVKDDNNYSILANKNDIEKIEELSFDGFQYAIDEKIDISGIDSFIGLKKLELLNFGIEDISIIKNLSNLEELTVRNCQITDIKGIEKLKKLRILDLGYNQITNISPLKKITNLEKLKLDRNEISDIKPLQKLVNLTGLDLSSNQITNLEPLKKLTKLALTEKIYNDNLVPTSLIKLFNFECLYLQDNRISDVSHISEEILKYTLIKNQKIYLKTNKKEVELPKIFLNHNYLELNNCALSNDKQKVIIENVNNEASVKIIEGMWEESTLTISYDAEAPSLMLIYEEPTENNKKANVIITSSEEIKPVEGWTLSENKMKLTKTYLKNIEENIKVFDIAGNESNIAVKVNTINVPILNITYSVMNDMSVNKGMEIVEEAEKYVGKVPYVLQGDSLTDGIDCSHFVYRILKMCGVYDGGYLRSTNWINVGEPVEDLEHAIAGDIIVWDGHVAIYDGQGMIIEAKGKKWGLTHDRDAEQAINKKTFLGIRRFTGNEKVEVPINSWENTDKNIKVSINSNKKIKPVKGWTLSEDGKILTKEYSKNTNEVIKIHDYDKNKVEAKINIENINK